MVTWRLSKGTRTSPQRDITATQHFITRARRIINGKLRRIAQPVVTMTRIDTCRRHAATADLPTITLTKQIVA